MTLTPSKIFIALLARRLAHAGSCSTQIFSTPPEVEVDRRVVLAIALAFVALGLAGLWFFRRRRRK